MATPLPSIQSGPSVAPGAFDPHFYAFLKGLLARIAALETQNAALIAALNEVRTDPTTVYPAI